MKQTTIFDAAEARRLRDEAIKRVGDAADEFVEKAMWQVYWLARRYEEITTDDLWVRLDVIGMKPREPRVLGAVMMAAKRHRWVEATDRVKQSKRPQCHCRPLRVWRSLVWDDWSKGEGDG